MTKFLVFIDESGEAGLTKIRTAETPGASPYLVLGAVVCTEQAAVRMHEVMLKFRADIGKEKWKHATDLSHVEKVYLGRILGAQKGVRFFSVISNKSTLGDYQNVIKSDPQKFYNKCSCYLLEMVCRVLKSRGASEDDFSVVFEERNHDYDRMRSYISAIKGRPIYPQSRALSILNVFAIKTMKKGDHPLLDVADFVSHSVYQLANKSRGNFNIPEPRYFQEIIPRFGASPDGVVEGFGVKCIHSLQQLELDDDIASIISAARAET